VVLAAVASVAAAACIDRDPISPSGDFLIVHGVLDLGASDQYVLVQRTDGARASLANVDGATVTLGLPDGRTITAEQVHDSTNGASAVSYRFPLARLGIALQPGGRYRLRVSVPDGRVVQGATTIPNATAAADTSPAQSFTLARDTLRLAWHRVPAARGYALSITSSAGVFNLLSDTTIDVTGETFRASNQQFQILATQHVVLSAVDTNYYDYYRSRTDFFTGAGLISHLDGAIGVFGSLVEIDARTLRLR